MISAVIVAAGSSRRMGFDKLSADLHGRPVLAWSLEAFENCEIISEIIIVTSPERHEFIESIKTPKVVRTVEGGAERHLSVWNGILATDDANPLIAVHDGARPLITPAGIESCAHAAEKYGSASLAHRVVETLKRTTTGSNEVEGSVSREDLWAMETPQIFQRDILVPAYRKIIESGELVTDEVSVVQNHGGKVYLVENPAPNTKITVQSDLALAEALISTRS